MLNKYYSEVNCIFEYLLKNKYNISCNNLIFLKRNNDKYTVEWKENLIDRIEKLEFNDLYEACECFIDLRHTATVGFEFDSAVKKDYDRFNGFLLGKDFDNFILKYKK